MFRITWPLCLVLPCCVFTLATGCASLDSPTSVRKTPAASDGVVYDPLEGLNRGATQFNTVADKYLVGPLTSVYTTIFPGPIRQGITNAARNLGEPIVFANEVLQLDVEDAKNSLGRFMINSTVGLAGFIDVAEKSGVPQDNEDFGQTLATYGVPAGPYIVLPLLGPSNLRDLLGRIGDGVVNPIFIPTYSGDDALRIGGTVANGLDARIRAEPFLEGLRGSADPYVNLRSVYTQNQLANIHEDADEFADFEDFDAPFVPAQTSQSCAKNLTGEALNIYTKVSPKVTKDTNLRNLLKKQLGSDVMGGNLSVKEARRGAREAEICLSLIKVESAETP